MQKKNQKIFFVSERMASQNAATNFLLQEENTCHRQPVG